jgi:hypothetical protein
MTAQEKEIAGMIKQLGGDLPDDMQKPFEEPTWEEVDELLRNANMRHFRLDIETDSTLKMDQVQEKQDRTELLEAIGSFLKSAEGADPTMMPLLGQLLMFAIRAFPVGKQMESCLQETVDALEKRAKQAQANPPPNPAMIKAQSDQAIASTKAQADTQQALAEIQARERADQADRAAQAQADAQDRQAQMIADQAELRMKAQIDQMKAANEAALERQRIQFEGQLQIILAHIKGAAQVEAAEVSAGATLQAAQITAANQAETETQ